MTFLSILGRALFKLALYCFEILTVRTWKEFPAEERFLEWLLESKLFLGRSLLLDEAVDVIGSVLSLLLFCTCVL